MNILTKIEELYEEGTRSREERRGQFPEKKIEVNWFDAVYGPEDEKQSKQNEHNEG
jgi:hypothetical protein